MVYIEVFRDNPNSFIFEMGWAIQHDGFRNAECRTPIDNGMRRIERGGFLKMCKASSSLNGRPSVGGRTFHHPYWVRIRYNRIGEGRSP